MRCERRPSIIQRQRAARASLGINDWFAFTEETIIEACNIIEDTVSYRRHADELGAVRRHGRSPFLTHVFRPAEVVTTFNKIV